MVKPESLEVWQLLSEKLQAEEEEKNRYKQQLQFITEHTAAILNEKIQMADELNQRSQELEMMTSLAQAIIHLQEPAKIMGLAVQKIPRILGVETAGIYLWNEKTEELTLSHTNGLGAELAPQVAIRKLGQGLIGMVAKSRQPFYASDVTTIPPVDANPTIVTGIRGFAAVPIVTDQNLLGVLAVGSPHTWECTPHNIEVLTTLGNLIATTMENARLYQDVIARARRSDSMVRISSIMSSSLNISDIYNAFVKEVQKLIPIDYIAVSVIDEKENISRMKAIYRAADMTGMPLEEARPLEGTASNWMLAHRSPIYEPDLAQEKKFPTDYIIFNRDGLRSVVRLPFISQGKIFGSLRLASRQPNAYSQGDLEMLEQLSNQIASNIANSHAFEEIARQETELETAFSGSLRIWAQSWERRYPHIIGHSDKVAQYARKIAMQIGLPETEKKTIEMAAWLHDIGLVTIPDEVMLRAGRTTPAETAMLEQHPQAGADMLRFSPILQGVTHLIHAHHERYDGQGYPRGLKGDKIPLGARILAIAEDYSLMGMDLPLRPAFPTDKAIAYLQKASGSRYDPQVVQAFVQVLSA